MARLHFALFFILIACTLFKCDAQRQRINVRRLQNSRQLARQEVENPITPYPSADELKPEIPFSEAVPASNDEPATVETGEVPIDEAPEVAANEPIPDEVYGPPEVSVLYNSPMEVYGPPEVVANALPADTTLARQRQKQARLIQARRQAAYHQARLAKLRTLNSNRSI